MSDTRSNKVLIVLNRLHHGVICNVCTQIMSIVVQNIIKLSPLTWIPLKNTHHSFQTQSIVISRT